MSAIDMKKNLLKAIRVIRDCSIENARDLYLDEHDEIYPNQIDKVEKADNELVWFHVLDDARDLQQLYELIEKIDSCWVEEIFDEMER